jgi:hypothetical protein
MKDSDSDTRRVRKMNLTELCDDIQRIHCCGLIGDDITSTNVCDKIGMRGILQHC